MKKCNRIEWGTKEATIGRYLYASPDSGSYDLLSMEGAGALQPMVSYLLLGT